MTTANSTTQSDHPFTSHIVWATTSSISFPRKCEICGVIESKHKVGIGRHIFEVFDGSDPNDPSVWCKHCNTTLSEIPGLHPICPFCEGPTECLDLDCVEPCRECEIKQLQSTPPGY